MISIKNNGSKHAGNLRMWHGLSLVIGGLLGVAGHLILLTGWLMDRAYRLLISVLRSHSQPTPQPPPARSRHIPASVRRAVFERDKGQCITCGTHEDLSLDHEIPWSKGGAHSAGNLRVLCMPCNRSKGARL